MQKCLDLAIQGLGKTKSNPLVGCVVVHNHEIIGQGFHEIFGAAHAEVNAINSVKNKDLLPNSILYVNLEPCAHYGKTPPCANLIIESKIPKVVIGALDTFSEVNGKGIELLEASGIRVIIDVLKDECRFLNRRFYTFHEKKRPYIILKWAQSTDGFMDKVRASNEKSIFWITQPQTKKLTHRWRTEEMGILVGRNSVEIDNPSLSAREFKGDNPTRIVIDPHHSLEKTLNIFNNESNTLHLSKKTLALDDESFNLAAITDYLFSKDIISIIVEGGKYTLNQFISENLWDEARVLTGNILLNQGLKAPQLKINLSDQYSFGLDDVKIYFRNSNH
jgi:diaminohydroxyphosphoribosylaminopyrimidine deaminase/5-amino-6-(5-phosphoribosylamino)uracil reductase